ncbi:VanZ family protein [Mariprofundus ferrooxydans]|uniref:VanZ-like domain-containing protein n=1 Tax=Mariprofundus ferrooxydans PV-1 TaxID=314345 RepID=Q0F3J1_9PROT|nr:VanZ family protein [Mariprofundus ferrooxydans]EAU55950.1 hypothetical protein SPV1_03998 [Mariprofundus ferrooxydans PV-1]KON48224.1 teicoplanin resistance protein VanZ [Mariprofundus ferrooxydans]
MSVYVRWAWRLCLVLYCLLIYALSAQSHLPVPLAFSGQDKLIHAAAYAGMSCLFWHSWPGSRMLYRTAGAVLFCSLYGISDEWHQSFVAGRDASVFDWLADTAGAILLVSLLYKRGAKAT